MKRMFWLTVGCWLLALSVVEGLVVGLSAPRVYAQRALRAEDIDFNIIPKIVCAIIPGCGDAEGSNEEVFPTPNPNEPTPPYPTPELLPTSTTGKPGSCTAPEGRYICGSRSTLLAGCGHCGIGYPPDQQILNCDEDKDETWGTAYAIDIAKSPLEGIVLPTIDGQSVMWYQYAEKRYRTNAIQRYSGTANEKKYILQLHHTLSGSGIGIGKEAQSGQQGAKICVTCVHVHIQIYEAGWKSATDYYCH